MKKSYIVVLSFITSVFTAPLQAQLTQQQCDLDQNMYFDLSGYNDVNALNQDVRDLSQDQLTLQPPRDQ